MKVLHVSPSVARLDGGPAEVVRELVPALRSCGVETDVYATRKGITSQDNDIVNRPWLRLFGYRGPSSVTYSGDLVRAVQRDIENYDLLHVHGLQSHVGSAAMRIARRAGVPYVVQPHGALDTYQWSQNAWRKRAWATVMDRENWRGMAALIVSSSLEAEEAVRVLPWVPPLQWPLGVDRRIFAIPEKEGRRITNVLYLARITRKKRLDLLLGAMATPGVRALGLQLTVAGASDGSLAVDPRDVVKSAGMSADVEFLGSVTGERRLQLLKEADVFVLPSEDGSFGISVAEAMAAGLPVIATDRVGVARDAPQAVILADLTEASVAAAIVALGSGAVDIRMLGRRAREHAVTNFAWAAIAKRAEHDYRKVLVK